MNPKARQVFRPPLGQAAFLNSKMVKRAPMVSYSAAVQTVTQPASSDSKKGMVKKNQAWRYPGGVIKRGTHLPAGYRDHIDTTEPRRKQESNFFITINTNKTVVKSRKYDAPTPEDVATMREAVKATVDELSKDATIIKYLRFGPKHPEVYGKDNYNDVIDVIEWKAGVEEGEELNRLHCHIWMTVHHYSQVQINCCALANVFKLAYNEKVSGRATIKSNARPYVHVKLLPCSDWTDIMRQYIQKAMSS
jgi:hypothetical protein